MKIYFDWSAIALNEEHEIDVLLTTHAMDRSRERYGLPINIKREDIEELVRKSANILTKNLQGAKTFVIHGLKSNLNIVGALVRKGKDWLFKVITVMLKSHFFPKAGDRYLEVTESLINGETFKIFIEDSKIPKLSSLFDNKKQTGTSL